MNSRKLSPRIATPTVTIHVSGELLAGHLSYLDQLVQSAKDCRLWPLPSCAHLEEVDRGALLYLIAGENRDFAIPPARCSSASGWTMKENATPPEDA